MYSTTNILPLNKRLKHQLSETGLATSSHCSMQCHLTFLAVLAVLTTVSLVTPAICTAELSDIVGVYTNNPSERRCSSTLRLVPASPYRIAFEGGVCENSQPSRITFETASSKLDAGGALLLSDSDVGDFLIGNISTRITCSSRPFLTTSQNVYLLRPSRNTTLTPGQLQAFLPDLSLSDLPSVPLLDRRVYIATSTGCIYSRSTTPSNAPPSLLDSLTSSCFPASATVRLSTGIRVRMDSLSVGDSILANSNHTYSPIFLWTHHSPHVKSHPFLRILLSSRPFPPHTHALTLTHGHFVYADGRLMQARHVRPGALMRAGNDGSILHVLGVSTIFDNGLFNPHTLHGDLVVDDVIVSSYTETIAQPIAHALLAPIRAAYCSLKPALFSFSHT